MRIATLNIRHGGGKRIEPIRCFLISLEADVVLLTEYRENAGGVDLRHHLAASGYECQSASSSDPKTNSILLASKKPFTTDELVWNAGQNAHRLLFARFTRFNLFGVYFPQRTAKQQLFEHVCNMAPLLGDSGIVLGDFNTGLPYLDETGNTFACVDGFLSLNEVGLTDSWRARNPDVKEFSWFSAAGNGFRIDHAFCTSEINEQIVSIRYLHNSREKDVTDHSALVIDLAF